MALNIHTDSRFERYLEWLSHHSKKTKTDIIKELVFERYQLKRGGFKLGALKTLRKPSPQKLQKELKRLDKDHDLD